VLPSTQVRCVLFYLNWKETKNQKMFSLTIKVFILCVLFAAAEEDSKEEDLKFGKTIFILLGYTIC